MTCLVEHGHPPRPVWPRRPEGGFRLACLSQVCHVVVLQGTCSASRSTSRPGWVRRSSAADGPPQASSPVLFPGADGGLGCDRLQGLLGGATGYYGENTLAAVKKWQVGYGPTHWTRKQQECLLTVCRPCHQRRHGVKSDEPGVLGAGSREAYAKVGPFSGHPADFGGC